MRPELLPSRVCVYSPSVSPGNGSQPLRAISDVDLPRRRFARPILPGFAEKVGARIVNEGRYYTDSVFGFDECVSQVGNIRSESKAMDRSEGGVSASRRQRSYQRQNASSLDVVTSRLSKGLLKFSHEVSET